MSTIEERLDDIRLRQTQMTIAPQQPDYIAQDAACAAIIAAWTAAYDAMKAFVSDNFWQDGDDWQCYHCTAANGWREHWHTPDECTVVAFQAAIAAMEGTDEHD